MLGDIAEQRRPDQEGDEGDLRQRRDVDRGGAVGALGSCQIASGKMALVPTPSIAKPSSEMKGAGEKNTSSSPTAMLHNSTRATPLGECRSTKLSAKNRAVACENANSATAKPEMKGPARSTASTA